MINVRAVRVKPNQVNFIIDGVKVAFVIDGNVGFWPQCIDVIAKWREPEYAELANFMAPFIAEML
jgi:hypothetical protein